MFAAHGKRSTVNVADIKLCARKDPHFVLDPFLAHSCRPINWKSSPSPLVTNKSFSCRVYHSSSM